MIKTIKKKAKAIFFIPNIVYVLIAALIVRLVLSNFGTLSLDQGTFIAWSVNLAGNGFKSFYNGWSDYLPGYLYVLWFLGEIRNLITIPDGVLYKLPAIFADVITGYLIYKIVSKYKNEKLGILGSILYLFNPAAIANSTLWGQVDSFSALTLILVLWFFENKPFVSAFFLSVGVLIKPQVAFILPVILFLFLKKRWTAVKIMFYSLVSLATFIIAFIPFSIGKNLPFFVLERVKLSLNQYPYTSVNAFNFWGLFGFWKPDTLLYQYLGYFIVLVLFTFIAAKLWKEKRPEFILTSAIFVSSFLFFTRIHERHLLPVFAPLIISAAVEPLFLIPYLGFSLIYVLNLYYSFNWIAHDFESVFPDFVIQLIIFLGIFLFLFFVWSVLGKKRNLKFRASKTILTAILIFAFAARVFNLGTPSNMYFDEIYHAFTAKLVLHADSKAWEWWNPHPEGFAYEWTHPPLSKLGMALGMKILGENAFGYRFPQALLGTGVVFLIYLLTKKIFDDEMMSLLAAFTFSLDGLPLTLSRMAMNDIYFLFFALASIYFFLREKNFWSALTFGLALSSKWSAIWTLLIIFIIWLRRKNKFSISLLWFLVIPLTVYLASYAQMFLTGHDLGTWWGMQKQMWWYHTGLNATHPYTSPWWQWPLLVKPIYLYTSEEVGGFVSRIYAMGNPIIFWFGLVSVLMSLVYSYFEKNKKLGLITFAYLIFFIPWAISPRIMFLYHYLPSIPFMCMAIAYILRRNPKLIFLFFISSALLFIYFYPHWTGIQVPIWLEKSYYWIDAWR